MPCEFYIRKYLTSGFYKWKYAEIPKRNIRKKKSRESCSDKSIKHDIMKNSNAMLVLKFKASKLL